MDRDEQMLDALRETRRDRPNKFYSVAEAWGRETGRSTDEVVRLYNDSLEAEEDDNDDSN